MTICPVSPWMKPRLAEAEQLADTDGKREAYIGSIQAIIDGYLDFTVDDFAGRVHTNFSRLKRELKTHLRIDGQRLIEIDIRNSQPTFLAIVAWQRRWTSLRTAAFVNKGNCTIGWPRKAVGRGPTSKRN